MVSWLHLMSLHAKSEEMPAPLPSWVWRLSSRQVRILLAAFMHGDSAHNDEEEHCSWCSQTHPLWGHIVTSRAQRADELQALAMHAGLVSSISLHNSAKQCYRVFIHNHSHSQPLVIHTTFKGVGAGEKKKDVRKRSTGSPPLSPPPSMWMDSSPAARNRLFWCVTTAAPSSVILVRRRVDDEGSSSHPSTSPIHWFCAFAGNCKNYWNNNKVPPTHSFTLLHNSQ